MGLLEEEIRRLRETGAKTLPGETVFRLYDTFGFPVDLTADILTGHGMVVDQAGFESAMRVQRERARAAWKGSGDARVDEVYARMANDLSTTFQGYDTLELSSRIRAVLVGGELRELARAGEEVEVIVDDTPFYAESGGQVGDRGSITTATGRVEIVDTRRPVGELVVHRGRVAAGEVRVDASAELAVDAESRRATVRNHSGTHLLHAALRRVLGPQAMQKGSLVEPGRLRFDYTHDCPLSLAELREIEGLVNAWIETDAPSTVREMGYPEAIESGAIALFEEKYGDRVRVISFGEFSTELCGGTHARATGEIGLLKIVSESGIAAGVRRIEALTGLGALEHVRQQEETLQRAAALLKTAPRDVPDRIEKLMDERRELEREIEKLRAAQRGAASADLSSQAKEIGGTKVVAACVEGVEGKALRAMVDELRDRLRSGVVLLAAASDGGVTLALGVTPDLVPRFKAGDLVREIASIVGGKGGGRPDFAQAGGKDASRLPEAFERLEALVAAG
jgi:alanyl-tRNA synthetase